MRLSLLLLMSTLAWAQADQAYLLVDQKQYDAAIPLFLSGIEAAPARASLRKDLAYTYLKIGEPEQAREQFAIAMRLDPSDFHVALEYAFLCHDTKMQAEARRQFDRIRKAGDPESRATAERAFQNIDGPLAAGIERWKRALELAPENFTAHHELAGLAEQRDELVLAAEHYRRAWELLGSRKQTLLDMARVWKALNRLEESSAALLAASRSGEPRAQESALEQLPARYPFVYEFRLAIEIDPRNIELRRELAYLLLAMDRAPEAEREFLALLERAPDDLLSCAQMGFLYLVRGDRGRAMPLLERALRSTDVALSNRVRAALRMPLLDASEAIVVTGDSKAMAERSIDAGYLMDALQFLKAANVSNPKDSWVMLKLGWTYNVLHTDDLAIRWFRLARASSDPLIAAEASKAYRNLRPSVALLRVSGWLYPFFSTRWHDAFGYGQIKAEIKLGKLPLRPYASVRLLGDTRRAEGPLLSESAVVAAAGIATNYWRGITAWAEAGSAISYLASRRGQRRATPDYRGGVSFGHGFGRLIGSDAPGWFFENNTDAVFISRYENDVLLSIQTRAGITPRAVRALETQLFWNNNLVRDWRRLEWANFVETGPGLRFRWAWMPKSLLFSVSAVRGAYSITQHYREQNYFDVRTGFWYAFTR